jgi:hypothetical protein
MVILPIPSEDLGRPNQPTIPNAFFTVPNEDLGRSTNVSDLSELRFRTFHGREYRLITNYYL